MWTEPSLIDALAVAAAADRVVLRQLVEDGPFVPVIERDHLLRSLAALVLGRDIRRQLEAHVPWDLTPAAQGGRIGAGFAHPVCGLLQASDSYDVAVALTAIEGGARPAAPGLAGYLRNRPDGSDFLWMSLADNPRGEASASQPRATTGDLVTPPATKALAVRIYAAALAQNAADASIDADLAAACAATLAATRASFLAHAQALYPARGYT
jgi:hypothetical protein